MIDTIITCCFIDKDLQSLGNLPKFIQLVNAGTQRFTQVCDLKTYTRKDWLHRLDRTGVIFISILQKVMKVFKEIIRE